MMTNAEAIETLRANYPDACFEQLREAVDVAINALTAQSERLTDDDFETIRIHLNACKEKLCNQQRWEEAEEYQRIIDRFMAFASAQPEQIRCKDCGHHIAERPFEVYCNIMCKWVNEKDYCSRAERREDD